MRAGWLAGGLCVMAVAACTARPSGVAVMPTGQTPPASGRVLAGEVTGAKVGPQTKVALGGSFLDAQGVRLDALGKPTTEELLISVPVKDKRYGFDLPKPPYGAVSGAFTLMVYDDANGNNRQDAGEAYVVTPQQVTYTANVGFGIVRGLTTIQDPAALGQVNLTFD